MKKKHGVRWLVFVFVCSLCAAAMSLSSFSGTQARYRTNAGLTASAQVAGWNPRFSTQPAEIPHANRNPTIYRIHVTATNTASNRPASPALWRGQQTRTFAIQNSSDVVADISARQLRYVVVDYPSPVTAASPRVVDSARQHGAHQITFGGANVLPATIQRYTIGLTRTYTVNIRAMPFSNVTEMRDNRIRRYRVYFDAVQVD